MQKQHTYFPSAFGSVMFGEIINFVLLDRILLLGTKQAPPTTAKLVREHVPLKV